MTAHFENIRTWRERIGQAEEFPLHLATDVERAMVAEIAELRAASRPTDDELWDATLRDRDAYHEWADKLANAIAAHFGVNIGEHSNQNLPWSEALDAIEGDRTAQRSLTAEGAVPDVWISEVIGPEVDDLSYGQGYRRGWNDCRTACLAAAPLMQVQPSELLDAGRAATPRAATDVEKLPPLPSTRMIGQGEFGPIYGYDDRQMQDYARSALKAQPAPTEAAQGEYSARLPYVACAHDDSTVVCDECRLTLGQSRVLAAYTLATAGTLRYTCIGKGGTYEVIGDARGAGTLKSSGRIRVYRDAVTGGLFYRTLRDFDTRMELKKHA